MPTCPQCKGKGKFDVTSTVIDGQGPTGRHEEVVKGVSCYLCDGSGEISEERLVDLEAQSKLWCSCGNKSGHTTYHPDGQSPVCHKHHWICNDCGKIVQMG